jgi:hypothetical protein
MRLLTSMLILFNITACGMTLVTPIWHGDDGVAEMCVGGEHDYTYEGQTKSFNVHLTEPEDLYAICGDAKYGAGPAQACIVNGHDIYTPAGVNCPKHVAHELNHGFGNDFVDSHSYKHG